MSNVYHSEPPEPLRQAMRDIEAVLKKHQAIGAVSISMGESSLSGGGVFLGVDVCECSLMKVYPDAHGDFTLEFMPPEILQRFTDGRQVVEGVVKNSAMLASLVETMQEQLEEVRRVQRTIEGHLKGLRDRMDSPIHRAGGIQ